MSPTEQRKIANTVRYCFAHCDNDTETETVAWLGEHLATALGLNSQAFKLEADYALFAPRAFQ